MALALLRNRKPLSRSLYTNLIFAHPDEIDFSYKPYSRSVENVSSRSMSLMSRSELFYRSPGIRQNTALFEVSLERECVVCLGDNQFNHEDCMLLCSVLRHPLCKTKRVIFQNVDGRHSTFEFDLIQSIGKSVSLRSVIITEGMWHPNFFVALFETVQKINPRIVEVAIENLDMCKISPPELYSIGSYSGKLVSDFFNYSVPGIRCLSLHGVGLRDCHLEDLIAGLSVNSSITTVSLSKNLIEDGGLCGIVRAISRNRRSMVSEIDLSWNLITGLDSTLTGALRSYNNPVFGRLLSISLYYNHIRFSVDIGDEFRNDLQLLYDIDPRYAGLKSPVRGKSGRIVKKHSGLESSKSATNILSPVNLPMHQSYDRKNKQIKVKFKSKPLALRRSTGDHVSLNSRTADHGATIS